MSRAQPEATAVPEKKPRKANSEEKSASASFNSFNSSSETKKQATKMAAHDRQAHMITKTDRAQDPLAMRAL
ncbi:hypothetical protein OPT61_g6676 [Boeremia exigua]|uniref:Uncharacterized protein n=1 Tax=Boeremia exigua TaxID=749465 RepID=A0ACC2I574_9PLEO|nr:hypothetical protein OPT61_g6676 [Boeremia exigua]